MIFRRKQANRGESVPKLNGMFLLLVLQHSATASLNNFVNDT
jgi:hypothetical protein